MTKARQGVTLAGLLFGALGALGLTGGGVAAAAPAGDLDPPAAVSSLEHQLARIVGQRAPGWSPAADAARIQVDHLIDDRLAVPALAQATLGSHWEAASQDERRVFTNLFRALLAQRLAAGALLNFRELSPPRIVGRSEDETVDVAQAVRPSRAGESGPHQSVVTYRLKALAGRWRVVDLIVAGESLEAAYREQFARVIARERLSGLLDRMRRRLGPASALVVAAAPDPS